MLWLWILGILAFLILLFLLTRVGIHAMMQDDALQVDLMVGWLKIHLLPKSEKETEAEKKVKENPKKAAKREAKAAQKAALQEARKGEPLSVKTERFKEILADAESAWIAIWPAFKKALHKTCKSIRIYPLQISVTVGAQGDPASGAQLYGYLNAGVWTAMPVLEQLIDIPEPYIHTGIDFDSTDTILAGEGSISIRIGTLLGIGIGIAVPALRWFLQWNKRKKQPKKDVTETTKKG